MDSLQADSQNARTHAMLQRLRRAMQAIEADIQANQGLYPFNFGRVTQSELCRRADVKKATLQTPLHKESTRMEVLAWLNGLEASAATARTATRARVTAQEENLQAQIRDLQRQLEASQQEATHLRLANGQLRAQLGKDQ